MELFKSIGRFLKRRVTNIGTFMRNMLSGISGFFNPPPPKKKDFNQVEWVKCSEAQRELKDIIDLMYLKAKKYDINKLMSSEIKIEFFKECIEKLKKEHKRICLQYQRLELWNKDDYSAIYAVQQALNHLTIEAITKINMLIDEHTFQKVEEKKVAPLFVIESYSNQTQLQRAWAKDCQRLKSIIRQGHNNVKNTILTDSSKTGLVAQSVSTTWKYHYKQLAIKYHPDKYLNEGMKASSTNIFKELHNIFKKGEEFLEGIIGFHGAKVKRPVFSFYSTHCDILSALKKEQQKQHENVRRITLVNTQDTRQTQQDCSREVETKNISPARRQIMA